MKTTLSFLGMTIILISYAIIGYPRNPGEVYKEKTVAVLPPTVFITLPGNKTDNTLTVQQETEALNLLHEMFNWMVKRKEQGKFSVNIQDIEITQSKLKEAGIPEGKQYTHAELCRLLGVDEIIISRYDLKRVMTWNQAVALGASTGVFMPNTRAKVSISAYNLQENNMVWNYNRKISCLCTDDKFANQVMRPVSKKMPYYTE